MVKPIVVVSGASRGLGLALATLYKKGDAHHVVALVRKTSPAVEAAADEVVAGVDLSTAAGVDVAVAALKDRKISLLINNAGTMTPDRLTGAGANGVGDSNPRPAPQVSTLLDMFAVNAVSRIVLVDRLVDCFDSGAKIVNISSRVGSTADNTSSGLYGYRASMAALNNMTVGLAIDMKPRGVAVGLFHPGMMVSDMTKPVGVTESTPGAVSVDTAATNVKKRIDELSLETSGKFIHAGTGEGIPW